MHSEVFLSSLSFIVPILMAFIIFIFRSSLIINTVLSIFGIFIAFLSTFFSLDKINHSDLKFLQPQQWFYIDGFSILMQLMVEFVSLFVIIYSLKELPKLYSHRKNKFYLYFCSIMLSTGFMNLAFSLNNLFFMYIALELSSIISVYLITFNLNRESLKAGFKYLLIVNVGILFSLLGIVLLCYAFGSEISISNIGQHVGNISKNIALTCAVLFIIGFFTKAGLFPFHIWLPETYAESPSAITVFLAGAVTKIGFYGLARTVTVFAFNLEEIKILVIILSSIGILLGAILAFNQKDIKKLIAYCSISEMGFIASALALNNYAGIYGGVFHLLNHTLMKGALFFSVGILIYTCGSRLIDEIKIRHKISTITISFFIGALAVGGMPPFSSFLSSVTIILALAEEKFLWSAVVLASSGFISALALLRTAIFVFWNKTETRDIENNDSLSFIMKICSLLFAILLLIIGIYPELFHFLIDNAARGIINTTH